MVDPMNVTCVINQHTAKCGILSYTSDSTVMFGLAVTIGVCFLLIIGSVAYFDRKTRTILYETGNDKAVADLEKATKVWRVIPGKKGND